MPTGEPVPDSAARFDVLIESAIRPTTALVTLTATSGWGEEIGVAEAMVQDLVDLVASSEAFRLIGASITTAATAPITPTPTPPEAE